MSPTPARLIGTASLALLVSGCRAQQPPAKSSTDSASTWVVLTENPRIRITLDTSRIERADARHQVWMGFDLPEPWPPMENIKAPYRHFEARQDVDCAREQTKGLAMRFVDVNGRAYDESSPDSTWKTFREHPLTEDAFRPLCRALESHGSR